MKKIVSLIMCLWLGVTVFGIEGILEVNRVMMDEEGKEYVEVAKTTYPGDVLEYVYVITNNEDMNIMSLQPVIPVPDMTELMPETIEPSNFMVSVDGNTYMNYPVLDPEGKEVPNSAYKGVKWMLGAMKPGDVMTPKMRVKVDE